MTRTHRTAEEPTVTATARRTVARAALMALLAPLVATAALALGATPALASGGWQWHYDHQLRCWNAATYDGNRNGRFEVLWLDVNRDCRLDTVVFDTNGRDDLAEQMWVDADGDGRWDAVFVDTDQRVGFEYYFVDADNDGWWERQGWIAHLRQPTTADIYVGPTSIGAPTDPSGFCSLMVTMSSLTGRAVG